MSRNRRIGFGVLTLVVVLAVGVALLLLGQWMVRDAEVRAELAYTPPHCGFGCPATGGPGLGPEGGEGYLLTEIGIVVLVVGLPIVALITALYGLRSAPK